MSRLMTTRKVLDRRNEGPDRYPLTISPAERLALAWRLSLEAWSLAHPGASDEQRLQRTAVHIHRG